MLNCKIQADVIQCNYNHVKWYLVYLYHFYVKKKGRKRKKKKVKEGRNFLCRPSLSNAIPGSKKQSTEKATN